MSNADLDHAIRAALGDIVAVTPRPPRAPYLRAASAAGNRWQRPVAIAAVLTAAAGLIGIVVAATDWAGQSERMKSSPTAVVGPGSAAGTGTGGQVPVVAPVPGGAPAAASPCGSTEVVPARATNQQTIMGDIDGDLQDDTVTLYALDGDWHVNATSSVKGWASDTVVKLDVHDTMSISFEDIDYSLGAETKPALAVMATGQGSNDKGIIGNFTFLTNTPKYCIAQWTYKDEPFQWVALQAPGHVTGMNCETAAGSRYYSLVDSSQNDDGSWRVVTRVLSHNFTRAEIRFLPEQSVADSAGFVEQYGNINGCDHPPMGATGSAPTTTTADSPSDGASGATTPGGPECSAATSVPADAADQQTISGDIDGDQVADTVMLFREAGNWFVYATSSVTQQASIVVVTLDVQDTMSIGFSDIDYGLGYDVSQPYAVIAIGQGDNDRGITSNFTFLTNAQDYCLAQWTYQGAPFQWVALQAPGHVTGMTCGRTAGSSYFILDDAVQQSDGTWELSSRRLQHDFAVADIAPSDGQTVADSPTMADDYGTLAAGCTVAS